ncbi:enoyl-CoA hydratase [Actinobacteria bacterium YIM 96077]|uniref:enoyl-CoA hydratase n=1 Tax=Phytoactinopolyspora halophila TaxID=1981511 RepID=A0A329R2L5_9ACTN|nr:enoyl-CoA hydratase-related protein [Phytoactinopolyspora halophila]AYY11872.1 enoyl-CoA hydratase [Actinobacteria bacterium YIM 96077]RAW18895.1 enoyl-CoA hydratase [Phytoactinopolyspora halophila]
METVTVRRMEPEGVVEVVLDRPDALNALSTDHARAIASTGTSLAADTSVRAVVVSSSSDRAFCVGADLKERHTFTDDDLRRQREVMRQAFASVLELPVPTIAAIHGYALGGGFELALSCDLIVVDESAVVGLPEVSVGLVPGGGGTQLLTRRVGWGQAADLVFTARRVDGDEAYELGLADRLVQAGQARETALELATRIAANSPVGVRQAKGAMRLGMDTSLAAGLEIEDAAWRATAFSPDRREGIAAFNEKRSPMWPGP